MICRTCRNYIDNKCKKKMEPKIGYWGKPQCKRYHEKSEKAAELRKGK